MADTRQINTKGRRILIREIERVGARFAEPPTDFALLLMAKNAGLLDSYRDLQRLPNCGDKTAAHIIAVAKTYGVIRVYGTMIVRDGNEVFWKTSH